MMYIPGTEGVGMESVVAPVADVLLEEEEKEGSPLVSSTSLAFLAASSSSALRSRGVCVYTSTHSGRMMHFKTCKKTFLCRSIYQHTLFL